MTTALWPGRTTALRSSARSTIPTPKSNGGDTQTGYVLALHMNLVPEKLRPAVAQKLADKIEANHGLLGTGFLGTPYLLEELTRTGHADLAYKLLLNTAVPFLGLSGGARRDDDVGALERRSDEGRPQHELLQPLRLWRGGRLALSLRRRRGRLAAGCRLPHRAFCIRSSMRGWAA